VALRLRRLLPILLVSAAGCGLFGTDASTEGEPEVDTTAVADTGASPDDPVAGADSVPRPDTSAAEPGGNPTAPGVPGAEAGDAAAEATEARAQPVDTLDSLLARIDSVLASQQALSARLDSIAGAAAPADTVGGDIPPSEVLGQAGESVQSFTIAVVLSVVVVILFNLLIRGGVWLLDTLAERQPRRRLFYKRLVPITRIVLWIFAAYLIVRVIFQIDAQGIFAAAAAIGVAVGFAAQDLLKNLFGGLILVFDQPFQVGDKVSVGDTYGEVVSIGLRSTRIVTADDNLVSVPNAQVVDQQVANANAGQLNCQVVTDLYLPGWADEETAKRIAFQAASSSKYVFLNKPIVVLVSDVFKETFLTRVRVKAYVLDPRFEFLFQSDITERARAGFRDAGLLRPEHMRGYLVEQALTGGATASTGAIGRGPPAAAEPRPEPGSGSERAPGPPASGHDRSPPE